MEKILNEDEKIRRAEEIYFRRNNQNSLLVDKKSQKVKSSMKDKIILEFILMVNIAIIVFCVQNKDYIFSDEFLSKINEYNVNISSSIVSFIEKIVNPSKESLDSNENSNELINNETLGNVVEETAEETPNENPEIVNSEASSSISEMDMDVENLKNAYSLINPIEGTITSRFGLRESENKNVEGFHTGIDIATEKGTYIKSSFDGIVTLVSNEGDYGKHLKIRCNNITMLYAHCQNIFVKEGQIVGKGQEIATVGSTGNSTGPHLHFEIRVDDRFVDPLRLLKI